MVWQALVTHLLDSAYGALENLLTYIPRSCNVRNFSQFQRGNILFKKFDVKREKKSGIIRTLRFRNKSLMRMLLHDNTFQSIRVTDILIQWLKKHCIINIAPIYNLIFLIMHDMWYFAISFILSKECTSFYFSCRPMYVFMHSTNILSFLSRILI